MNRNRAGESWQLVLAGILKERSRQHKKALGRSLKNLSEKNVHDCRIETRRLLTIFRVLASLFPDRGWKRCCKVLKKFMRQTNGLRDLQAQICHLREYHPRHPELAPFLRILRVRERCALRTAAQHLETLHIKRVRRRLREGMKMLKRGGACENEWKDPWRSFGRTAEAAFRKARECSALMRAAEAESIHAARLALKKFRYMLEAVQPLWPGVAEKDLKALHDFQTALGDWRDADLLLQRVDSFSRTSSTAASCLARFERELAREKKTRGQRCLLAARTFRAYRLPPWPSFALAAKDRSSKPPANPTRRSSHV